MNNLLTRTVSGLFYSTLLVFSAYYSEDLFYLLLFGLSIILLIEFNRLMKRKNFSPFLILFLLFYLMKEGKITDYFFYPILLISILMNIYLMYNLFTKKPIREGQLQNFMYSTFYISTSLIYLYYIARIHQVYNPTVVIGIFVLVWINDSFAYLVGISLGKRKLFERISPKKTIEGFLGGLIFCLIGGVLLGLYSNILGVKVWVIISLITAILGTIGDLIQSKFKRQTGVKNSGNVMPGHGGIYDRLDSIIFVAPFILTFMLIFYYVS
jgi:phosphatidate cytidylyltransferase